jgi:hypothetical protein
MEKEPIVSCGKVPRCYILSSDKTGAHWFRLLVRGTCCMPGKLVDPVINPGKTINANYDEELALAA